MDAFLRDLKFAVRGLARTPGFAAAAIVALALGIGATTAIFSVVHAVLLQSLGFVEETRLVGIRGNFDAQGLGGTEISAAEVHDLRNAPFFTSSGSYVDGTAALLAGDRAERVRISLADAGLFRTLGVQPHYGRAFSDAEEMRGNDGVALVSWSAFLKRYGGDPSAVGRTVTINGVPRTIVGVLPESFRWEFPCEFWVPPGLTPHELAEQRGNRYFQDVARLAPGVTLETARARLLDFSKSMVEAHKSEYPPGGIRLSVEPLRDRFAGGSRPGLLLLFGAVFFVLLIACANVANLLLARGAARTREMAVRSALGAGRARIVRQLLTESALLAAVGAALGVLAAAWSLDALLAAAPAAVRQLADVRVSRAVLAFALVATIATTLAAGLVPALQASRVDLSSALHDSRATAGRRAGRLRAGLVVSQFALSLMLLVGAGLLLRSFAALLEVKAGFDPHGVIAARAGVGGPQYEDAGPQIRYWEEAMRRVNALPGVVAAGGMNVAPLEGTTDWSYMIEGYTPGTNQPGPDDQFRRVTGGFFAALRIPVIRGREFSAADDAKAPPVALVNEAWARRWFPGQDVVGKRLKVGGRDAPWRSIVGVVGDAHDEGLEKPTPVIYYVPESQMPDDTLTVMVRTEGDLSAMAPLVRQALASVDPTQPVDFVEPFEARVGKWLAPRRFPLQLLGTFAALALVLSALGIYGVTAYGVTQRTREIGVRIAIGAQRADVLRMVMAGAAKLAGIGVLIGLCGAFALAQLIKAQLFAVSAADPMTYLSISVLLALVALLASLFPALRATRVDPISALRAE